MLHIIPHFLVASYPEVGHGTRSSKVKTLTIPTDDLEAYEFCLLELKVSFIPGIGKELLIF